MPNKSVNDLTATDHVATLQSRAAYLTKRIAEREDKSSFYDQRELAALTWALDHLIALNADPSEPF